MKNLILILLSSFPASLAAQALINGRVMEDEQGKPLQYATVMCYDEGWKAVKGCVSGRDGRFTLDPGRAGEYRLIVSMMGYAADTLKADSRAGTVDVGDVTLRAGVSLDEVTVTGQRQLLTELSDRYVYDVSADPDAKRKKMMEIMEKIPLLQIKPEDGKLSYLNSPKLEILVDGERHEMINTNLQFPMSLIRGDVMSQIEIIPPGSPEYNNTIPIINIKTARALPNGYAAEVNTNGTTENTLNPGLSFVSKIRDKVIFSLGYRFRYSSPSALTSSTERKTYADDILTDFQKSETESGNMSRGHNISARASVKLWNNPLRFGVSTAVAEGVNRSTVDMTRYDGDGQLIDTQNSSTRGTSNTKPRLNADASYRSSLPNSYQINYDYSYTDNMQEWDRITQMLNTAGETVSGRKSESATGYREHTFKTNVRQNIKVDRHRVSGNVSYTQRQYENSSEYDLWDASSGGWTTALFQNNGLSYTHRIANAGVGYQYYEKDKKIRGSTGLRISHENDRGIFTQNGGETPLNYEKTNLLPRVDISYRIYKIIALNAGYDMGIVRPNMDRLNPYVDDTDSMNLVKGNPGLDPERSHNFSLGTGWTFVPGIRGIFLNLLYSRIGNAIERITTVDTESAISTTSWANIGSRNGLSAKLAFWGLVAKKGFNISLWANYDYIEYRSSMPDRPTNYVSGFSGNVSLNTTPWRGGSLGFGYALYSDTGSAQSRGVTYSHSFGGSFSQAIIKNKLYASVKIDNPFESHRYITSLTGDRNFNTVTRNERRGRVISFSIRANFGRFRDRVGEAMDLNDDRMRATIPSQ